MDSHRSSLRSPSRGPWIALGVAALVVIAAVVWFLRGGEPEAPPPALDQAALEPAAPATGTPAGPDVDPATTQALIDAVSPDELIRKGATQGDMVRRWAIVTDNIAEGASPRNQLLFLAPQQKFSVTTVGGKTVIAPESYARYDRLAGAVASIDAEAAAKAYRALYGMVERAYRALGYPDRSFDRVTERALQRIVTAPVVEGQVEVIDEGGVYLYADPKLEAATELEKHLLRMGPQNAGRIKAKARELLAALGMSPAPAVGATR